MAQKLRLYLGLRGGAYAHCRWRELQKFIMDTIREHTDFSVPIALNHEKRIDCMIQKICDAFPNLFSEPGRVKTSRVVLQEYIASTTLELRRQHRIIEQDKLRQRRNQARGIVTRPIPKVQPQPPYNRHTNEDLVIGRIQTTRRNIPSANVQEIAVRTLSASPDSPPPGRSSDSKRWRPLFSPSRPKGTSPHFVPANRGEIQELISESEDDAMSAHDEPPVEHGEVDEFLASCKPSLTHLYPYLVSYGCTDLDYLKFMSELPDSDFQVVLEGMKTVEGVEAKSAKPMDWVVLKYLIRNLQVQ